MRNIVSGITDLNQYLNVLEQSIERLRPERCPGCGASKLYPHGRYHRQSDRENRSAHSLNPIPILRFYCVHCKSTCSVLPECIPPRRWYLWWVQQIAFMKCLWGQPTAQVERDAPQATPRPCTIKRWLAALKVRHQEFSLQLKARFSAWGYYDDFKLFWQYVLNIMPLSRVMFYLNGDGVIVP